MKLYCFPRSGNSREVKIALHEKNVPFEPVNTHADGFDKENAEFRKASVQGKVPAIIDGDIYMSEAFEINQYLEQKYPKPSLMPADGARKKEIQDWVAVNDKRFVLKIGLLVIECLLKPKDQQKEETKTKFRSEITDVLREFDKMLEGKQYLFGDYSLADISVTPHIAALPMLGTGIPADLKNTTAWFARIQARPSFQKSAA